MRKYFWSQELGFVNDEDWCLFSAGKSLNYVAIATTLHFSIFLFQYNHLSFIIVSMEYVSGNIKLRDIFLENGNWWKFHLKYHHLIRTDIVINILKLLSCRTFFMGFHAFSCLTCNNHSIKVPHSCKSRICPSCGKKATDVWKNKKFNSLPKTSWQHITFTLPQEFRLFFWYNRYLLNHLPRIAALVIQEVAASKNVMPGIFAAIHTFGRDMKRNPHVHLSVARRGLLLPHKKTLSSELFFYHKTLKNKWRFLFIDFMRKEFKAGNLTLPPQLKHISSYEAFASWTSQFYSYDWVVHLSKPTKNVKHIVEYIGNYLRRPPIGETRITDFDGHTVTFKYIDHYTKQTASTSLPVHEFIARFIQHIPDYYFRVIRYYGFLSNRLISQLLPLVRSLLRMPKYVEHSVHISWRSLKKQTFGLDPLLCPHCKSILSLTKWNFGHDSPKLFSQHKEIAHGLFQLISKK